MISVLIYHVPEDDRFSTSLRHHLKKLEMEGVISGIFTVGSDDRADAVEHVESEDIIVFLVSEDLLASRYSSIDIKRALARHRQDETLVIPLIVRECDWQHSAITGVQPLLEGEPVTSWESVDAALMNASDEIRSIAERIVEKTHTDSSLYAKVLLDSLDGVRNERILGTSISRLVWIVMFVIVWFGNLPTIAGYPFAGPVLVCIPLLAAVCILRWISHSSTNALYQRELGLRDQIGKIKEMPTHRFIVFLNRREMQRSEEKILDVILLENWLWLLMLTLALTVKLAIACWTESQT